MTALGVVLYLALNVVLLWPRDCGENLGIIARPAFLRLKDSNLEKKFPDQGRPEGDPSQDVQTERRSPLPV
jgi:hypothetical protein